MRIIDTHQHLWDLDLFSYSWLKNNPALNRTYRMEDYLEATRGLNVEKSVHVEADVDDRFMLDETLHVAKLAEDARNPLAGVVATARPERPDFAEFVERLARIPQVKGVRRVLHVQPDSVGESPLFAQNVARLADYGLSFDFCVQERQLPIAIGIVQACPKVSFVLDHCGSPRVKEKILDPWRQYIEEIAGLPNVVCKVSGLLAYADYENWKPEDLRPYVEHVIGCFGWDRVMFGSDWPVCTLAAGFQQWVETLNILVLAASEDEREKLFAKNAERVYRLA
jgi:predicted TIM-barrel fold metal-dependent hydrolase